MHLLETDHVVDVHDLYAWTVTSDLRSVSAHVVVTDVCFSSGVSPTVTFEASLSRTWALPHLLEMSDASSSRTVHGSPCGGGPHTAVLNS